MAAFERFSNVYDVALKPRLLRTLLKDQVPDENRPLRNPCELSSIVSTIRAHRLLSESFDASSTDKKHAESWKSAVDAWVDRISNLASSDMPDKCWAGICLLGVTCRECDSGRFLQCYAVWFNQLLSHIQVAGGSQFVKVASCASASDLLTRLGGFPNLKKDGTSQAGKLVLPMLKLLNENNSAALLEVVVALLLTIITFFPTSVHRHYDNAETALMSKIMTGSCNSDLLKKLACCLALLPKSRGDAECWFQLLQKILFSISFQLNEVLEGLEEESKRDSAIRLLVQPGKDPPLPLGHQMVGKDALITSENASRQSLVSTIASLMQCCSTMLTSPYPVQVTVPVRPILVIIRRVLLVDGSLPQSFQYTTAMQQEFVCCHLPTLHHYDLEVLAALLKGLCSQLLPHAADIARLLVEYLKRCRFPELRIKIYSIIKIMLDSMGVGISLYLSQETINNAIGDINAAYTVAFTPLVKSSAGSSVQSNQKKRKLAATMMSEEKHNVSDLGVEGPKDRSPEIAMKVAALEAIEALLTVGGSLGNDSWRAKIDDLLILVATRAGKMGWAHNDENVLFPNVPGTTWVDYQLAALRALLASLIAPACVRPPFLAQGLELFRKGKLAGGARIAEFCAHALLALEILIHPRGLPLADFPSPNTDTFVRLGNSGYPQQKLRSNDDLSAAGLSESDEDDFLNDIYLQNGDTDALMPGVDKAVDVENETSKDQDLGEHTQVLDSSSGREAFEERGQNEASSADSQNGQKTNDVEMFHEPGNLLVPIEEPQGPAREDVTVLPLVAKSESVDAVLGVIPDSVMRATSGVDVSSTKSMEHPALVENLVPTRSDEDMMMLSHMELDDNESSDSFPDIVDGDPDIVESE